MGIKERRTKILLTLFFLSDVQLSLVILDEKIQKIFDIPFNEKTRGTLSGLLKEETIQKGSLDNQYALTEKGYHALSLQFPFCRFLKENWDGKWRIISYEIPETKRELRDRLRREMQGWGLGPWHRSFWITPHPIIETLKTLVSQKEEEKYIQAFESAHSFGNRDLLIEKVWGLQKLTEKYRSLFKTWHEILSQEGEKIGKMQKVLDDYLTILKEDPGLPKELVGEKWIGFEAFTIFKEIREILLS
jgi:phenylacetic acid degradation operon negative regulatory protein